MKKFSWIMIFLLAGCGGSLSREERKQLKEASEMQEIKKVTEAQITEAVLNQGREIAERAGVFRDDPGRLDSLGRSFKVTLRWITPGASNALDIEQQIIDAYITSSVDGDLPDNVQEIANDSILYSRPVISKTANGAIQVDGMWSVVFSKKNIILGM
jgi:hypothetical protein